MLTAGQDRLAVLLASYSVPCTLLGGVFLAGERARRMKAREETAPRPDRTVADVKCLFTHLTVCVIRFGIT